MKKPAWIEEFTSFAVKGNAMALAVGTIIGAAFSTITKSLTDDIIMPRYSTDGSDRVSSRPYRYCPRDRRNGLQVT